MIQSVHIYRWFFSPGVMSYMFMYRNDVYVHIYEYMNEGATTDGQADLLLLSCKPSYANTQLTTTNYYGGGYD